MSTTYIKTIKLLQLKRTVFELNPILTVKDLSVSFNNLDSRVTVIDGVSFYLKEKEIIGIVGESGSGKSVTSRSIMGMVKRPGSIDQGSIMFNGTELVGLSNKEYQKIRGNDISMIFQEPMTALNPVYSIGDQMVEVIKTHLKYQKKQSLEYAEEMLSKVGISEPKMRLKQYPHELSGGMRQRVMIAISLLCNPKLLIADEPTTALDVTIQAQILELMQMLCSEHNMSTIFITHDMGIVAEMCNRVEVMYAGKIVESAYIKDIFNSPLHPYTADLLRSIPKIGERPEKLYSIPGSVINLAHEHTGCRFYPRCSRCFDKCKIAEPHTFQIDKTHSVSCWLYEK